MLGDIKGLVLFDAFSGTGALAIEAVSRGAKHVVAVEFDIEAIKTISANVLNLGIDDKVTVIRKDVKSWSRNNKTKQFDVVLIDPPYDDVKYTLLHQLASHTKVGGLLIYSLPPDHDFTLAEPYELISNKNYGDATLVIYRRIS